MQPDAVMICIGRSTGCPTGAVYVEPEDVEAFILVFDGLTQQVLGSSEAAKLIRKLVEAG